MVKKYGKEVLSYSDNRLNFKGEEELMVTITLEEYRNLIEAKAKSERDEMQRKLWSEQARIKELESQLKYARESKEQETQVNMQTTEVLSNE